MLVVTEDTIANRGVLETRSLPKRFFGRVTLWPRRADLTLRLRLLLEVQVLRYFATLAPFVLIPLTWEGTALPISQAPLVMLIAIAAVELRVLRLSKAARARAVPQDEAARRLDMLAFRARACLRRIAARQGIRDGELRLVVEQSELARVPPLTLVSVQTETPEPRLLRLTQADIAILHDGLFDADLTEAQLLAVNQREDRFLRDIAQEARAVSAHSRLAAFLDQRASAT
jgi:hypothetical protein